LFAAASFEAPLNRPQELVRISSWIFLLWPGQEFAACPPWFGFEPALPLLFRRHMNERVGTGADLFLVFRLVGP
jgi:hypothetical protein